MKIASKDTRALRWVGLTAAGVGLVSVAIGTYYGIDAGNLASEINERGNDDAWTDSELNAISRKFDDGESAETKAIVFTSIGAALAVGGGIVWYLGHRKRKAMEHAPIVVPTVGPSSAGATLLLRF